MAFSEYPLEPLRENEEFILYREGRLRVYDSQKSAPGTAARDSKGLRGLLPYDSASIVAPLYGRYSRNPFRSQAGGNHHPLPVGGIHMSMAIDKEFSA